MDSIARQFDAPPDSAEHADLRDSIWLAGREIEGQYLLGMILSENLFRVSYEDYCVRLKEFIAARISPRAAQIFCSSRNSQILVPYLKRIYELETDFPAYTQGRNERLEKAVEHLLHHLDATPAELAAAASTTEMQILRMMDVKLALSAIRPHDAR